MLKTAGRVLLRNNAIKKLISPVVEFYDNQPVFPDIGKVNDMPVKPCFHVGGVMPLGGGDVAALNKLVGMAGRDSMKIAEVGSWTGTSTSILSLASKKYNGSVYAIDHWHGNVDVKEYDITKTYDVFSIFRNNMKLLGCQNVHPLVMPSLAAAELFADESLDMVFIDADHRYAPVKADILHWMKKVKPRGIISGHDCECFLSGLEPDLQAKVRANRDIDFIRGVGHCGVILALSEIFNDGHTIIPGSCVWYIKK